MFLLICIGVTEHNTRGPMAITPQAVITVQLPVAEIEAFTQLCKDRGVSRAGELKKFIRAELQEATKDVATK